MQLDDSGHRQSFGNGAQRERAEGKGRFDLIPPEALTAAAEVFEAGAKKYGDRNWERGIPPETCIDSALRHITKMMAGKIDEDHAALAMVNLMMFVALKRREGVLNADAYQDVVDIAMGRAMLRPFSDAEINDENACCASNIKNIAIHEVGCDVGNMINEAANSGSRLTIVPEEVAPSLGLVRDIDTIHEVAAKHRLIKPRPIRDNPQA